MDDVVIVSGVRTPVGRFGGAFVDTPAATLGAAVIREAVRRAGLEPQQVEQVILGCAGQFGEDAYVARTAAVHAGLPHEVPAYTVNRICGSGLEAINTAARWIQTGDADIVVAGGTESMSRYPYLVRDSRWGIRLGHAQFEDGIQHILNDPFHRYHMGITAENLAQRYDLSRARQDELAVASHQRAAAAQEAGYFDSQIVPLEVKRGRETVIVDQDEGPRRDTSVGKLATLPPVFKEGGMVTAGNASTINDGAAAVVLMSARRAAALGIAPKLRLVGRGAAGVEPAIMGIGPVPATQQVLRKTGLRVEDLDVVELNEAFACVLGVCSQELGLDPARTNPNGGAVALGHPVGATGAILTVKLLHELERRQGRYGLVTLCIGGGQGIATVFERVA